jgi:outer membrane protein TolC
MRITLYTIALAGILSPWTSYAWGWKDAAAQALEKNQNLKMRQQDVEAAHFQLSVAKSPLFPSITLRGGWSETLGRRKEWEYSAFVGPRFQWILYQGGKIGKGIDIANSQENQADLGRVIASIDLNLKLRQAYANALYSKNFVQLAEKIEGRRLENVKFTELRYKNGLEFKWVYASSKVKWEKAKVDLENARLDQGTSLRELEAVTGVLPIQKIEDISDENFYSDEGPGAPTKLLAELDQHPQMRLQNLKVTESRLNVGYVGADQYPTVALQGDTYLSSVSSVSLFPYLSAGIALSVPIFQGNYYTSRTAVARVQQQQALSEATQARLDLTSKINRTYQDYVLAKNRLEVSRQNLEASKDRARVVSGQYKAGNTSFLDWERSQDDWVTAETELLTNIRGYQTSRARYEEAIGVELSS